MELQVGPFDPELHVRSRDHYEAVRREIRLLQLQPGEPPVRLEDVKRYRAAYLGQAREQFQAALG